MRLIGRFLKIGKPWNKAKNDHMRLSSEARMMMVVMIPSVSGLETGGGAIAGMARRAVDWPRPIAGKPSHGVKRHAS